MARIFISYAHADQSFVKQLDAELAKHGVDAWYDRKPGVGLQPGETWQRRLQSELNGSPFVCVILSPDSTRDGSFVENEYLFALEQHLRVIPVVIRECTIPLALSKFHRAYFSSQSFSAAFAQLLGGLNQPSCPTPSAPSPIDKTELRRRILRAFNRERLEILCADINSRLEQDGNKIMVSPEIVGGNGLEAITLNLIEYLDRRGLLPYLLDAVRIAQPNLI